ncbi:MAG TPA: YoaK family protein [Candidatus Aquilonibacter sp.]|nr:YoaK family protein [Candidatus Aquilonibacter sp.]
MRDGLAVQKSRVPAAPSHGFEKHWPKILVALVLTFASGLVDIIGYLGVFHLFTAHLTGATVQLGRSLISHNWIDLLSAGVIVGSFVSGSIFGRAVIEAGSRRGIHRIASVTLAMEAILLAYLAETALHAAAAPANAGTQPYSALSLLAGAMGIQTATLTGIGPLTVHTTFVTGMINKLAQLVSHIAFRAYDMLRKRPLSGAVLREWHEDIKRAAFLSTIWVFYVGGAAFGTWSYEKWQLRALFFAVGMLTLAIITDQFVPLSIQEEIEQSER